MARKAFVVALLAVTSVAQQARAEQTFVWLDVRRLSCSLEQVPALDEPVTSDRSKEQERPKTTVFRGTVDDVMMGPSPRLGRFVADADVPVGLPKRGEMVILSAPKTSPRFCKEATGNAHRFALSKSCDQSELQSHCYRPFLEARAVEDYE